MIFDEPTPWEWKLGQPKSWNPRVSVECRIAHQLLQRQVWTPESNEVPPSPSPPPPSPTPYTTDEVRTTQTITSRRGARRSETITRAERGLNGGTRSRYLGYGELRPLVVRIGEYQRTHTPTSVSHFRCSLGLARSLSPCIRPQKLQNGAHFSPRFPASFPAPNSAVIGYVIKRVTPHLRSPVHRNRPNAITVTIQPVRRVVVTLLKCNQ